MKRNAIFVLLLLLLGPASRAEEVELERWLRHMRTSLPVALCERGTAIRTCFSLTQQQCELGIASAARSCIADMKPDLPKAVRLPDQGNKLGGNIGDCTANAYAAANKSKYVASEACTAARSEAQEAERPK